MLHRRCKPQTADRGTVPDDQPVPAGHPGRGVGGPRTGRSELDAAVAQPRTGPATDRPGRRGRTRKRRHGDRDAARRSRACPRTPPYAPERKRRFGRGCAGWTRLRRRGRAGPAGCRSDWRAPSPSPRPQAARASGYGCQSISAETSNGTRSSAAADRPARNRPTFRCALPCWHPYGSRACRGRATGSWRTGTSTSTCSRPRAGRSACSRWCPSSAGAPTAGSPSRSNSRSAASR